MKLEQRRAQHFVTPRFGTPTGDTAVAFPLDKTDSQYLNRFKTGGLGSVPPKRTVHRYAPKN